MVIMGQWRLGEHLASETILSGLTHQFLSSSSGESQERKKTLAGGGESWWGVVSGGGE